MNCFVVDASVTMAWCFEDECDEYADEILDRLQEHDAIAPALWPLEVVNVLLVAERRRRIRPAESARYIELLRSLPIRVESPAPEHSWATIPAIGRDLGLSAHDAAYFELAMRHGVPLATRDTRLVAACSVAGIERA